MDSQSTGVAVPPLTDKNSGPLQLFNSTRRRTEKSVRKALVHSSSASETSRLFAATDVNNS